MRVHVPLFLTVPVLAWVFPLQMQMLREQTNPRLRCGLRLVLAAAKLRSSSLWWLFRFNLLVRIKLQSVRIHWLLHESLFDWLHVYAVCCAGSKAM